MGIGNGLYFAPRKNDEIYNLFIKEVVAGRKGMWVSKTSPMVLRGKYGFVSTSVVSLSDYIVSVDGKKRIEKSFFEVLDQFMERYQNMIILLEDVEEIIDDSFSEILDLVKMVSVWFLSRNMVFILALSGKQDEIKAKILEKDYGFLKI